VHEPSAIAVFAAALATALATGLGAVPFLFAASRARGWVGFANALAAGFMLAASGLLFYEGARDGACEWSSVPLSASSSSAGSRGG
jgi:ZIP family zinc transporter